MSRIFDALRRSERERAGHNPGPSTGDENWQDLVTSMENRPEPFAKLEHIQCRLTPESHIVVQSHSQHAAAEKFRVLSHRLHLMRQRRPLSRLLVTSAVPREGKTVISINLAVTLARTSSRVALVDADLRQPGVMRTLGLQPMPGLAEFLEDGLDLASAFKIADPLGLYYLPAGKPSANPVELLQSPRMVELITQTSAAFDWVIFDSPPLNPFADAHRLAHLTDGVVLVVRSGVAPREGVLQGLAALEGAYVAGVVLNATEQSNQDSYYYYYYRRDPETGKDKPVPPPEGDSVSEIKISG
jgi:capsular exopolysaccharide synthesis family protein